MTQNYVTVKIPKSLADDIDRLRELKPDYRSRAEVVVTALRDFLWREKSIRENARRLARYIAQEERRLGLDDR